MSELIFLSKIDIFLLLFFLFFSDFRILYGKVILFNSKLDVLALSANICSCSFNNKLRLSSFKTLILGINNPSSSWTFTVLKLNGVFEVLQICFIILSEVIGELIAGIGTTSEETDITELL